MKKICILNYGSGNVQSVLNIFSTITDNVVVSNKISDISSATHIVLPGVGAFGASMKKIKSNIPFNILEKEVLINKKPFLGICVGLQILADKGFEFGEHDGFGWIHGTVEKIDSKDLPLPHVGWNSIRLIKNSPLLKGFKDNQDFYFVHSYAFRAKNVESIIAKTEYGEDFISIISKDNIFGVQFHPEKSQKAGKVLLENFVNII